jgi:hypothetical protein
MAVRDGDELNIQRMQVVGRSLEGVNWVVYTFTEKIDVEGVNKLTPLLLDIKSTNDPQFLLKVLQVTEGHSSGDWSCAPLEVFSSARFLDIPPIIPSFEVFARDVGILSREFWYPRRLDPECNEKIEARLSSRGEFVEVRLLVRHGELNAPYFVDQQLKVLLRDDADKPLEASYRQARQLLKDVVRSYIDDGEAGVVRFLSVQKLTAIHRSNSAWSRKHESVCNDLRGGMIPDQGECSAQLLGAVVRYRILSDRAEIRLHSNDQSAGFCFVEIDVVSKHQGQELSASDVRFSIELIESLCSQCWEPFDRINKRVCEKLLLCPPERDASRQWEQNTTTREEALSSLMVTAASRPSWPETFFTSDGLRLLMGDRRCFMSKDVCSDVRIVREAVRGAQWVSIELADYLKRARPELFSKVTIFRHPHRGLKVYASNALGLSISGSTRIDDSSRADCECQIGDAVHRAFTDQERFGWYHLYEMIRSIAEPADQAEAGVFEAMHIPEVLQKGDCTSVEVAGRLAALLMRGGDSGLTCALAPQSDGCWRLTASSLELRSAVVVVLAKSLLKEIHFRYMPKGLAETQHMWLEVGALQCQRLVSIDRGQEMLLRCIRSYFRDQNTPEASVTSHPEARAFRNIASLLKEQGFKVASCGEVSTAV